MEAIFADVTVSMSEFKKNPAAVLRQAEKRPVAVLNHNKAAFYMLEPALFEAMLDELADDELKRVVLARMGERAQAIEVDIDKRGKTLVYRSAVARLMEKAPLLARSIKDKLGH